MNFLADYLRHVYDLPEAYGSDDAIDGSWKEFCASPQFAAKRAADRDSYLWDGVIEMIASDIIRGTLEAGGTLTEMEEVLRVLARETRFSRRVLSLRLREFLENAASGRSASRMVQSATPGVGYVFLARHAKVPKVQRAQELAIRCAIARGTLPGVKTVVGLATETPGTAPHVSWVIYHFAPAEWTAEDDALIARAKSELGFFTSVEQALFESPYPNTSPSNGGA